MRKVLKCLKRIKNIFNVMPECHNEFKKPPQKFSSYLKIALETVKLASCFSLVHWLDLTEYFK